MAKKNDIQQLGDFDLSIILPFYKKLEDFKKVLPKNAKYYERNGIEVIIVLDEPSEKKDLLEFIKNYPFINWKVVINEKPHEWRNPSKALNVGINKSEKTYIMVMSPESELFTDVIILLRKMMLHYTNHFAVGMVAHSDFERVVTKKNINKFGLLPYGSILTQKKYFEKVTGYNEHFSEWGGDDDNLRARLELAGVKKLLCPDAILIHREDFSKLRFDRNEKRRNIKFDIRKKIYYPYKEKANKTWGNDFKKEIHNYWKNPFATEQCEKYLSNFLEYEIYDKKVFEKNYKIIALIPAHNESELIKECIEHINKHSDGIIFLDDESTDGTYELVDSKKVLLKVKKKRAKFNDLENRNILLNIASFFRTKWCYFIDVDERFDERYNQLSSVTKNKSSDVIIFKFIQLWNDEEHFRIDYPLHDEETGLRNLYRMFRNKGRMQIPNQKELHFLPVPFNKNYFYSRIIVKHYGAMTRELRERKYNFYKVADKKKVQQSYDHLLDEKVKLGKVEDIVL